MRSEKSRKLNSTQLNISEFIYEIICDSRNFGVYRAFSMFCGLNMTSSIEKFASTKSRAVTFQRISCLQIKNFNFETHPTVHSHLMKNDCYWKMKHFTWSSKINVEKNPVHNLLLLVIIRLLMVIFWVNIESRVTNQNY